MIELLNRQRKIRIDIQTFRAFAEAALDSIKEAAGKDATIVFVSDRRMRELNSEFRSKNTATDVLSFPFEAEEFESAENTLGDIIISAEQAERQAKENNLDFETEIKQLILHGVLHLTGYDHETDRGEMNRLELKLRNMLDI